MKKWIITCMLGMGLYMLTGCGSVNLDPKFVQLLP